MFSLKTAIELCFEFLPRDVFICFACFPTDLPYNRRDDEKTLLDKTKRKIFCIRRKLIGTPREQRDFVRLSSKVLSVSNSPGSEILMGLIHILHNNVMYRLFVATKQSINDRMEEMFRLNTSQRPLRLIPTLK